MYANLLTPAEKRKLSDYDLATCIMYDYLFSFPTSEFNINDVLSDEDLEDITMDIYVIILDNKKKNLQRTEKLFMNEGGNRVHKIFSKYLKHYIYKDSNKYKSLLKMIDPYDIQKYENKMMKLINFRKEK